MQLSTSNGSINSVQMPHFDSISKNCKWKKIMLITHKYKGNCEDNDVAQHSPMLGKLNYFGKIKSTR